MKVRCKICGKEPHELQEYIDLAKVEKTTPEEYAKTDGTYNRETGFFYCTMCYIRIGMPLGTA